MGGGAALGTRVDSFLSFEDGFVLQWLVLLQGRLMGAGFRLPPSLPLAPNWAASHFCWSGRKNSTVQFPVTSKRTQSKRRAVKNSEARLPSESKPEQSLLLGL